ncbi:hypothetical protein AAAC51_06595 [Priestia megaterium]
MIYHGKGKYECIINGHRIVLVETKELNVAQLYIDNIFQGMAPLSYTREKMIQLEDADKSKNLEAYSYIFPTSKYINTTI